LVSFTSRHTHQEITFQNFSQMNVPHKIGRP